MGWLDHSTNNIILDAVLTDYGRQQLASANSTFKIDAYALGDDEVDYRNIKKYGRTVGKERIEKLTPIFEAMTNPNIALKYMLLGRSSDASTTSMSSIYLPVLKLASSTSIIGLTTSSKEQTVTINLTYNNTTGASVPADMIQTVYSIRVSDRFFYLAAGSGTASLSSPNSAKGRMSAGDPNRIATYTLTVNPGTTSFSFKILARSIDNTTLSVYGKKTDSTSSRTISSYITVKGEKMGTTLDIPVTYKASLTA